MSINFDRFDQIITDSESFQSNVTNGPPLFIKWGADPSAPDLHLGHAVILTQLAAFQRMGHTVLFLIGDFTARIGDPTGKSATRPPLSEADVKKNAETYLDQVFTVLDPNRTTVVYNSTWLQTLSSSDMIRLCSSYTVARMLERDDFSKRFQNHTSIGIHEFLYPLLQGYDSVHLKNDVEIGGTDQTFNLLVGRHLQKDAGIVPQSVLTLPLLEGTDGVQKMSKSLNNHIAIQDTPTDMFGKCMSIPDHLILRYTELLTDASSASLNTLKKALEEGRNPRDAKLDLSHTLVKQFHSVSEADQARSHFIHVFSNQQIPNDMPHISLNDAPHRLVDVMHDHGFSSSKKDARRLIQQGAVRMNDEKITDVNHVIQSNPNTVVRIGKRLFFKIV